MKFFDTAVGPGLTGVASIVCLGVARAAELGDQVVDARIPNSLQMQLGLSDYGRRKAEYCGTFHPLFTTAEARLCCKLF